MCLPGVLYSSLLGNVQKALGNRDGNKKASSTAFS